VIFELAVYRSLLISGRFSCRRLADQLLTFAYYNTKKENALPARVRDERGDTKGFPVVAVPYHVIQSVEFNPGTVKDGKARTKHSD